MNGEEKQNKTSEIMAEIKNIESAFKQQKASANLACQQGDFDDAEEILEKMRSILD